MQSVTSHNSVFETLYKNGLHKHICKMSQAWVIQGVYVACVKVFL